MVDLRNANDFAQYHRKKGRSQEEQILDYLTRYKTITPLEAMVAIRCYRLSARIYDLRQHGHRITMERAEGDAPYGIYTLEE